jgi:type I restriction enzyme R subunit
MPESEAQARTKIDQALQAGGWSVQRYRDFDPSASRGIALTEVPLNVGTTDYLLLVDRKPVGIIEAKKSGTPLSGVAEQSGHYGDVLPDFLAIKGPLPFLYESTGIETYFRDRRDPDHRSRRVFTFHRPETLAEWHGEPDTLRKRLAQMPFAHPLKTEGMRDCQVEAITNLERSFAADRPRSLIQMATGAGKTFTACAFTYRLIKYAGARRVLFLVDRANLSKQARDEFAQYITPDTARKFTELYNVQLLQSNNLDTVCKVTICTIQRLYSMLRGEPELNEDLDEISTFELSAADNRPKEVAYNPAIPIETFDFIVTDECHRSIYNLWRQVLEYFDAFLIGLTATPSKQTIGFFNQNLVTEYTHERAVTDGVNVGYDVYRIRTEVTDRGSRVEKGQYIDKRCKQTRAIRWQQLDEDFVYEAAQLDRSVVVPSQIRTVIQAYKDALFTDLFPGRALVPKTLIFAKDDSHAEDIVHIVREVFGKGNDFAKKITYKTYNTETHRYEKSESLIQEFRTSPTLRIAVTVDMIATGTDIKPLECLLFLRDVRSRVYFEQMKGRGTRVLSPTDLKAVSGDEARAKTHFIIVDAVGVCESDKTDSRPLEKQPSVKFDKLLLGVALGKRDEDTVTTLAGRLARLDREIDSADAAKIKSIAGQSISELASTLLKAIDPDVIAERATGKPGASPAEVTPEKFEEAKKALISEACAAFESKPLRDALVAAKQEAEQTIDRVTIDQITAQGFDAKAKDAARTLTKSFRDYIDQHRAEIAALQILYSRPYKQRLTEPMLKELEEKLKNEYGPEPVTRLWHAFELGGATLPRSHSPADGASAPASPSHSAGATLLRSRSQSHRFADLVPLVRFALEQEPLLEPFSESVHQRFENWLAKKSAAGLTFDPDQRAWLELIRDHIATSLSMETDDFEYAPFSQRGGLGKAHQLFGAELPKIVEELNEVLAA